jgi:hypothetical protein
VTPASRRAPVLRRCLCGVAKTSRPAPALRGRLKTELCPHLRKCKRFAPRATFDYARKRLRCPRNKGFPAWASREPDDPSSSVVLRWLTLYPRRSARNRLPLFRFGCAPTTPCCNKYRITLRAGLAIHDDNSPEAERLKSQVPSGKAIPVVLIIIGILSIPVLWNSIQEMLRERYWGGVLIDSRSTPPTIVNSDKVPAKFVFIIDANGKITKYDALDFDENALTNLFSRAHR